MIDNLLSTNNMGLMQKALGAATIRNDVIANNLANVDTPGFKRSQVLFEDELKKALANDGGIPGYVTNPNHIPIGAKSATEVTPQVVQDVTTSMKNDGNNVDVDKESADLAKNIIMYNFLIDGIDGEFKKLKSAIVGR